MLLNASEKKPKLI